MLEKEHKCPRMLDGFGIQEHYDTKLWYLIEWDIWVVTGILYCPFCGKKL